MPKCLIGLAAAGRPDYTPLPAVDADPAFKAYANREKYRAGQVGEITRAASRESESRFYTSGMAQAMLLDHLLPGWKARAFDDEVMLEDLLREAVDPSGRS